MHVAMTQNSPGQEPASLTRQQVIYFYSEAVVVRYRLSSLCFENTSFIKKKKKSHAFSLGSMLQFVPLSEKRVVPVLQKYGLNLKVKT